MGNDFGDLSRRRFIKNIGLASVVAGTATVWNGLTPPSATAATGATLSVYETVMRDGGRLYARKAKCPGPKGNIAFETRQILSNELVSIESCDVVVIGAGFAGMSAALKAAELGANVVVLEKMNTGRGCCESCGAINSKFQVGTQHEYTEAQKTKFMFDFFESADWRIRPEALQTYVARSGEAVNFMQDMLNKGTKGYTFTARTGTELGFDAGELLGMPAGRAGMYLVREFAAIANSSYSSKISIRYLTPAVQLVKNGNGAVTGVIAKNGKGYLQINATKGVIIASGGYDANPEMMEAYCRSEDYASSSWWNPSWGTTGDGHMMGMMVGANMDPVPHTVMNFNMGAPDGFLIGGLSGMTLRGGLYIRGDGKRFVNDVRGVSPDLSFHFISNAMNAQPGYGNNCWVFIDNTVYAPLPDTAKTAFQRYKSKGWAYEASSVHALAEAAGINPTGLDETINKYNSYVGSVEPDFGCTVSRAFNNPPYYLLKTNSVILATTSGLMIDEKCRVLDTEDKVIEGLYAAGNASGNIFSGNYPRHISGVSIGRAVTFGYVSAEHAMGRL